MKREKKPASASLWHSVGQSVRENRLLTLALGAVVACDILLALLPPLVLEGIVNGLTAGAEVTLGAAALYVAALAAAGLLDAGQSVLITVFGQKITHGVRSALCGKLARLKADYYTTHETGKTVSLFVNDVDAVGTLFDEGIISMAADACKILGILAVVFTRSRGLCLLLAVVLPLLFVLTRAFQKRMLAAQLENRAALARVNNHVPETVRSLRMIRSLAKEKYMENRYDAFLQQSYHSIEKANLYDSIYSPIVLFTGAAVVAVMMCLAASGGAMQSLFGLSVGSAVAVIAYVGKVFAPLESIGMEIENIQSAAAGIARIDAFLREDERAMPTRRAPMVGAVGAEETEKVSAAGARPAKTAEAPAGASAVQGRNDTAGDVPAVALENVTFGYAAERAVLQGLSLRIEQGETVTLAGRTGAGKSTVFRLILGLYTPQTGRVRVLGVDACDICDKDKRRLFGCVEQSPALVRGTVAEQISLFDASITPEAVRAAAKLVGLDETICALENGYDTPCDARQFSQGQLQLLGIARAVAADPPILLLDEITANLDSGTEALVMDALRRACASRTVISISHRLYEQAGGRTVMLTEGVTENP